MSREGRWAIVTGASSGIGRALALEFASGRFNVVLTGRNRDALTQVATECSRRFQVSTEVFPADLARLESVESLVSSILSKPYRYEVLVNNAGFGIHGDFASTNAAAEIDLLNVQLTAALKLTKAVLPGMIARRAGRILNVASVYSYAPVPSQSIYSACKAFLLSFSASLRTELEGSGVTVTVFCPGVTQTEFRSRSGIVEKRRDSGMQAEDAARIAYSETLHGKAVVIPGLLNRLFVLISRVLPQSTFTRIVRFINRRRFPGC